MKKFLFIKTILIVLCFYTILNAQEDIKEKNYNQNRIELVDEIYKKDSKIKSIEMFSGKDILKSTLFDNQGRITEFIFSASKETGFEKTVYSYNDRLISEIKTDSKGKKLSEILYFYDDKGNLTEKETKDISVNSLEKELIKYDLNNRVIEEKVIKNDGSELYKLLFIYDSKNKLTEEKKYSTGRFNYVKNNIYDESGRLLKSITKTSENDNSFSEQYLYEYDNTGNLINLTSLLPNGQISYTEKYLYDNNNRLSEVIYKSDIITTKDTYKYDSYGNLTEIIYYEDSKPDGRKLIDYNLEGNVTRYRIYDKSDKLTLDRKREYDIKGNLKTDYIEYKTEKKSAKYTYDIKYYD